MPLKSKEEMVKKFSETPQDGHEEPGWKRFRKVWASVTCLMVFCVAIFFILLFSMK